MKIYQVDAFTTKPFSGNPAAVCILEKAADENWMRNIAAEMNLSETAFIYPVENGFNLRWFTPAVEVDLCGHATLATAHILWEKGILPKTSKADFHTRSGLLTAINKDDSIELNFPSTGPTKIEPPDDLLKALGCEAVYIGKSKFDYLVETDAAETIRKITPDFSALKKFGVRGVVVTAKHDDPDFDIISRFFAPGAGIDEDPVTGSAHCLLTPYWVGKLNKNPLKAYQASKRGGELIVTLDNDRVRLLGQAVTVMEIDLL